jgi:hypothetical protein
VRKQYLTFFVKVVEKKYQWEAVSAAGAETQF